MSTGPVLKQCAVSIAVITFSGCVGPQSQNVSLSVVPQVARVVSTSADVRSWMLPEAKSDKLLYVSGYDYGPVYVYSYDKAHLLGAFGGPAAGMCSDNNGNIWITNFDARKIEQYAHGGTTTIATLHTPKLSPQGCAVDPTSGNLAVVGYPPLGSNEATKVLVYAGAAGKPRIYRVKLDTSSYCAYDNVGDLFVTGYGYKGTTPFGVAKLQQGSTRFRNISFPPSSPFGGYEPEPVQWDGRYVALGTATSIVRYEIQGSNAVAKGETSFDKLHILSNAWIHGGEITVVNRGGDESDQAVQIYKYPAGGSPVRTVNPPEGAFGVTVSLAPD